MSRLQIITHENPRLRLHSARVPKVDDAVRRLMDDMLDTMLEAGGVGLAAPQVDRHLRVIVMKVENQVFQLANPEIVKCAGEQTGAEGCLSFPGLYGEVTRSEYVLCKALNRHGKEVRVKAHGLLARCIQHEIDHLDGVLFVDRLVPGSHLHEVREEDLEESPTGREAELIV